MAPTNEHPSSLIILNYHQVKEAASGDSLLSNTVETVQQHLRIIKESEVDTINLHSFDFEKMPPRLYLAITVDDGNLSDYTIMRGLLKEAELTACFFPLVEQIGQNGKLSWEQLRALLNEGFTVGSHGFNHEIITRLTPEQQLHEMQDSKSKLEQELGQEITGFAFPYGRFDAESLAQVFRAGYKNAFTTGLRVNNSKENQNLFYRWNISNKTNPEMLRQVLNSNGQLSPALEVQNRLKAFAQRMLGN